MTSAFEKWANEDRTRLEIVLREIIEGDAKAGMERLFNAGAASAAATEPCDDVWDDVPDMDADDLKAPPSEAVKQWIAHFNAIRGLSNIYVGDAMKITDEMVERAQKSLNADADEHQRVGNVVVRAALEAALTFEEAVPNGENRLQTIATNPGASGAGKRI